MTYYNAAKYISHSPDIIPEKIPGDRLKQLWHVLHHPEKNLKYLRLTGSNEKTVCSDMLMSIFQQSSYTMGRFTMSPKTEISHYIQINGKFLSLEETATLVGMIYQTAKNIQKEISQNDDTDDTETKSPAEFVLTKYEILLTTALLAFQKQGCDLCLIESDLDDTDPTRSLPPPFAVVICGTIPGNGKKEIQRIRSYIGHGIQEIITTPQNQETYRLISETCAIVNCRLTLPSQSELQIQTLSLSGSDFVYKNKVYRLNLCGKFQIINATTVLEISAMLIRCGFHISDKQIQTGLKKTQIPSEFEIISIHPTIIVDSIRSDITTETVCNSMADFRPLIGSRIRLCLPDSPIVQQYRHILEKMDYTVCSVTTFPMHSEKGISNCSPKEIQKVFSSLLKELKSDEFLFISGPYDFTSFLRYEVLNVLDFYHT